MDTSPLPKEFKTWTEYSNWFIENFPELYDQEMVYVDSLVVENEIGQLKPNKNNGSKPPLD